VLRSRQTGIQPGDVVAKMNGRPVANRLHYELALLGKRLGSEVDIEIMRSDAVVNASFTLDSRRNSTRTQLASTHSSSTRDKVYQQFGVRLEPANPQAVRAVDSSYRGGLRVTAVRRDSPAYNAQLQAGDILVGLLEWQTPDWDDLEWIMNSKEMRTASAPKFHIMRQGDVFWGTLEL
jgi:S1-C subfamily serine protease